MGRHAARVQVKNLSTWAALIAVYNTDQGGMCSVTTEQIYIYISRHFTKVHYPRQTVLAKLKQLRRKGYLQARGSSREQRYDPTKWALTKYGAGECRIATSQDPYMAQLFMKAKNGMYITQKGW